MNEKRIGFKERKEVDMKIYRVPSDIARWFKIWCDGQGLKFNQGMVLVKNIIEDYERFRKIESVIEENRHLITELYDKISTNEDKPDNPKKQIKKYGGNRG